MTEDLQRIRTFVATLVWWERGLLVARVALHSALLGVALVAIGVVAAALQWDRSTAVLLLVAVGGCGLWLLVALPLLLRWRGAGDPLHQARRVEALQPELRGRLLTAVERVDGARPHESEALLGLVAQRASTALASVSVRRVHPVGHVVRLAVAAAVLCGVALPLTFLAPGGPLGVFRWWSAALSAQAAVSGFEVQLDEQRARVGDLVLRYTYPSYTGLEPLEIPNSTGEVRAPPGTVVEVTARAAERVEAAGLVAHGERLDARVEPDGRQVRGQFSVRAEEGTYELVLYREGEPMHSRAFPVTPEDDLPPEVMLDAGGPEVIEIAVDELLDARWRARDDYGVREVRLQLNRADTGRVLYRMETRRAEVWDDIALTPRALGLKPGDRAELVVAAWDNDTVGGSKVGTSQGIEIVVLGARGLDRRLAERHEELIRLLLPVLARFLTEPWPPGGTSGELALWGETVAQRYEPLSEAVDRLWEGRSKDVYDMAIVAAAVGAGRDLIRYSQTAFTPDDPQPPPEAAFTVTAELRDTAVVKLERAVLALVAMRHMRALKDVAEQAEDLQTAAELLEELLSTDDVDAMELLARLDQLERMMEKLDESAADLRKGGLQEFLNTRDEELGDIIDEIRKAIAEGRLDEAREMMERLSQMVQEMAEGIQENLEQRQQQDSELGAELQELMDELERLEQEQRALQEESQQIREQGDERSAEETADLWAQVVQKARALAEASSELAGRLEVARRRFNDVERAQIAAEYAIEIADAAMAKDLRGARSAVERTSQMWRLIEDHMRRMNAHLPQPPAGPGPADAARMDRRVEEIRKLLDQLDEMASDVTPEARQQAEELEQRQRDLKNDLESARAQAQGMSRQMSVQPEGMNESLEEASERMDDASQDLGQGQLMPAEGAQGVAAERIREARESMQQAMEQMQRQQEARQPGNNGGEGDQDGNRDQEQSMPEPLEIPGREEFRTPEAYRRALLEGMEGDVPDEYRALKKRYYEELVHQ